MMRDLDGWLVMGAATTACAGLLVLVAALDAAVRALRRVVSRAQVD